MIRRRLLAWRATLALVATGSLALAACGGGGSGSGSGGNQTCPPDPTLTVNAIDTLKFSPGTLSAPAGAVTVKVVNTGALTHTFEIRGFEGKAQVSGSGDVACRTFTLTPGSYTYFCGVAGHEQAGMKGTLTVS